MKLPAFLKSDLKAILKKALIIVISILLGIYGFFQYKRAERLKERLTNWTGK